MFHNLRLRSVIAPFLILNLAITPIGLSAQQASADEPSVTIRANTRLVVVDVVVTDKSGQPVSGLKPEDFTLEENGKKQKISIFVPPGIANKTSAAAPLPPGIFSNHPEDVDPGGVPLVLLLDATNSSFTNQAYARTQMLKYVLEHGTGRQIAVLTLSDRLRVLQQFTSDPQVLMTAIKNFIPVSPILQSGGAAPSDVGAAGGASSGLHGGGGGSIGQAVQDFANIASAYNDERRTLITLGAMQTLSRMLAGLPGRKNVVWLTSDLPFDLVPEDRAVSEAELEADLPSIRQKSGAAIASGAQKEEARALYNPQIREAETNLASAGVAIYPVDLRGLVSGMENSAGYRGSSYSDTGLSNRATGRADSLQASHGTMEEVAAETGGKAYFNENEVKEGVALAASDEKASYSLGYYPENKKWDGKMRNIKVKLDKGDTQIRYRKGYFAIEPGSIKDHNYEQDVISALAVDAPATQVTFKAQAKPSDPGKVRVVFLVDPQSVTAEDSGGNKKVNVSFYASVWGADGKSLGIRSIKVDKSFDAGTYEQIAQHGMMVPIDLEIPKGGTELRLAVLDNKTGYIGTVSGPVGQ